jgi:hypothetical protein
MMINKNVKFRTQEHFFIRNTLFVIRKENKNLHVMINKSCLVNPKLLLVNGKSVIVLKSSTPL